MNTADEIREIKLEIADINRRLTGVRGGVWTPSLTLDDLTDVVITAPAAGAALVYNAPNWIDGVPNVALSELTDVNLTAPGRHHFLMYDPVAVEWINFELDLDFEDWLDYTFTNIWEALTALIRIEDGVLAGGIIIEDAL